MTYGVHVARLSTIAQSNPERKVRLLFKNENGSGYLDTTAAKALAPNKSGRYFPPQGEDAADLAWPVPYWYAGEIYRVVVF